MNSGRIEEEDHCLPPKWEKISNLPVHFPGDQRRVHPRRGYLANLREAAQRIRATQNVMHARGMTEDTNYRELLTRLSIRRLLLREAQHMRLRWRDARSMGRNARQALSSPFAR